MARRSKFRPGRLLAVLACTLWGAGQAAAAGPADGDVTVCRERIPDGHYVRASVLKALEQRPVWAEAVSSLDYESTAFDVKDGKLRVHHGWHETTEGGCARRLHGVWMLQRPRFGMPGETGPYLRVGDVEGEGAGLYFRRLFSGCWRASGNERWCFGNGRITINGQPHAAVLRLDTSESPTYGNVVEVDGERDTVWVFVPQPKRGTPTGWKVYRDTWLSDPARKDPTRAEPWRVLDAHQPAARH